MTHAMIVDSELLNALGFMLVVSGFTAVVGFVSYLRKRDRDEW